MEKGPAPLVVLFVLAVVTVDFVIQRTCFQDVWHDNVRGAFIGFCLAQVALLTLWMVTGSGHGLPRMMIGLTATLLLARLFAALTRDTRPNEWFGALCLFGFALATPLWLLHRQGICWVRDRVPFLNDRVRFWEREGEAPAEPLAQRELRPPTIALDHLGSSSRP